MKEIFRKDDLVLLILDSGQGQLTTSQGVLTTQNGWKVSMSDEIIFHFKSDIEFLTFSKILFGKDARLGSFQSGDAEKIVYARGIKEKKIVVDDKPILEGSQYLSPIGDAATCPIEYLCLMLLLNTSKYHSE